VILSRVLQCPPAGRLDLEWRSGLRWFLLDVLVPQEWY